MVGMPQVADVVEPAEMRAVACDHSVALGGGEQATEFRLTPQALIGALILDPSPHAGNVLQLPRAAVTDATGEIHEPARL